MTTKNIEINKSNKKRVGPPPVDTNKIELYPYGLVQGLSEIKPIFLLSDKKEKDYLAVWVDLIESESLSHYFQAKNLKHHPYQIHIKILKELGWSVDHLLFYKMDGYRLYGKLLLKNGEQEKAFYERAEDIMLLALYSKARIYCKKEIMDDAKEISDLQSIKNMDVSLLDYKSFQKYMV